MKNLFNSIVRFSINLIPLEELEREIYSSGDFESKVSETIYFDFIDFNFQKKNANHEMRSLIKKSFCLDNSVIIYQYQCEFILVEMLSNKISLKEGCKILSEIGEFNYDFVPNIFGGFFDEIHDEESLKFYRSRIIDSVKDFLLVINEEIKLYNDSDCKGLINLRIMQGK